MLLANLFEINVPHGSIVIAVMVMFVSEILSFFLLVPLLIVLFTQPGTSNGLLSQPSDPHLTLYPLTIAPGVPCLKCETAAPLNHLPTLLSPASAPHGIHLFHTHFTGWTQRDSHSPGIIYFSFLVLGSYLAVFRASFSVQGSHLVGLRGALEVPGMESGCLCVSQAPSYYLLYYLAHLFHFSVITSTTQGLLLSLNSDITLGGGLRDHVWYWGLNPGQPHARPAPFLLHSPLNPKTILQLLTLCLWARSPIFSPYSPGSSHCPQMVGSPTVLFSWMPSLPVLSVTFPLTFSEAWLLMRECF